MKARKRNIISFAICALFVAGLLAGSCYIKEGKQNAVSGYAGTEQGDIIWEYDTVSGDESSAARNVHIIGVYQDGKFSKKITKDIVIPDKVPECNEDGKLTASKITFYKEPKDYEIWDFILKKYNQLNFSPAVENVVIEKQKSYKKRQRDVRKQVQLQGVGTKSQQALKLQHDQSKLEHILQNKKQKELDKMRLFALKQQKKKEKHKGH